MSNKGKPIEIDLTIRYDALLREACDRIDTLAEIIQQDKREFITLCRDFMSLARTIPHATTREE